MSEVLTVEVIAGVVLLQDGKILLVQEKQAACYGKWSIPAGHVEVGESIEQAAVRETREETGFNVQLGRKLGIWQEQAGQSVKHCFLATITGGELHIPSDEILDARWFSLKEIEVMESELRDPVVLKAIHEAEGDKKARLKAGVDYTGIAVAFCCHDGKGNFLFHKRSQNCRDEQGAWDCGAGKLNFGEEPLPAIQREIREEYGCEGEIGEQIGVYARTRVDGEGRTTHWLAIAHFVKVDPEHVRLNEPESMEELGWFRWGHFPEPLHTSWQKVVKEFPEKFVPYC